MRACRAALLCALCLAACSDDEPTEVIIQIDADAQVQQRSSRLRVTIESLSDDVDASNRKTHDVPRWPFKLALQPLGGDATREYQVTAEALDNDDHAPEEEKLAIATVETDSDDPDGGFTEGKRRYVYLTLRLTPGDAGGGDAGGSDAGGSDAGSDGAVEDGGSGDADTGDADTGPTGGCDAGDGGCRPRLLGLQVSPGALVPTFDADELMYNVTLPLTVEEIDITAEAPAGVTSLSIGGDDAMSGMPRRWAVLAAGEHDPLAIVVGDDLEDTTYTLTVTRGAQQAYVKASDTAQGHKFGSSVGISENVMVIGAELAGSAGAAYVFERDPVTGWSEPQLLTASNPGPADSFGHAVAISGNTIVVGAPFGNADNSGAAYVFVRSSGGAWSQQAYLEASNGEGLDLFGWSVAIAGDTIIVGAHAEAGAANVVNGPDSNAAPLSGAAYVFVRSGAMWPQQAYLKPDNNGGEHNFGTSVAVDPTGEAVAVGAPGDDDDDNNGRGSAYVFERTGNVWMQTAQVKAGEVNPGEYFGRSVAMSQNRLAVGTSSGMLTGPTSSRPGAVHVFERANGFTMPDRLMPDHPDPGDEFGHAVAIEDDWVVVGAPIEAGGLRGVYAEAERADNDAPSSGAVYVFAPAAMGWAQLAYLKASNADSSDRFGFSVAISGGNLLIGAIDEASNATGVNPAAPAEADNTAPSSGAAYLFQ